MGHLKRKISLFLVFIFIFVTLNNVFLMNANASPNKSILENGTGEFQKEKLTEGNSVAASDYLDDNQSVALESLWNLDEKLYNLMNQLADLKNYAFSLGEVKLSKEIDTVFNELRIENDMLHAQIRSASLEEINSLETKDLFYNYNDHFLSLLKKYKGEIERFSDKLPGVEFQINNSRSALTNKMYNNDIWLDESIDIERRVGDEVSFDFQAPETGYYRFFTSYYGGFGNTSDTTLSLWVGSIQYAYNDNSDSYFSSITYWMMEGDLVTVKSSSRSEYWDGYPYSRYRLTVTNGHQLDDPIFNQQDVFIPAGGSRLFGIMPAISGTYKISTTFYGGYQTSEPSDTYLSISDYLSSLIAFNDDHNQTVFSEITVNLSDEGAYIVKLEGYGGAEVRARITIEKVPNVFNETLLNRETKFSQPGLVPEILSFNPIVTEHYDISAVLNSSSINTYVRVYSDSSLSKESLIFASIPGSYTIELFRGKTYYFLVFDYFRPINGILKIKHDIMSYIYKQNGQLDFIITPEGVIIDYIYDENGNLISINHIF